MDLSTTYLGLKLKHPVVPSASPLSQNLDNIRRLEDAGEVTLQSAEANRADLQRIQTERATQ